jgi:hypothetical protein
MIRKIWITNLVFAFAFVLMCAQAYLAWHSDILPVADTHKGGPPSVSAMPRFEEKTESYKNYEVITTNNLFSPNRAEEIQHAEPQKGKDETVAVDPAPANIEQNFTLYGIILQQNRPRALIRAPVKDKKESPVRWVSIGEKVATYTIADILIDSIRIDEGSKRYALPLYKKEKASSGDRAANNQDTTSQTPKIISTQSPSAVDSKKEKTESESALVDGKYKIDETPFGTSKIRIK